jgi:hypothetical protein
MLEEGVTPNQFWDWFSAHEAQLWSLSGQGDPWLDRLYDVLSSYRKGLSLEVSDVENGVRDLIISASGDRKLFGAVDGLVNEAPLLDRWRVIAFKPPRGFNFVFDASGIHLDPKALVFEPLMSDAKPGALAIRVYVPSKTVTNEVRDAVVKVVEIGLGEKAASAIEHIDAAPLLGSPDEQIALTELPAYIDWFRRPPRRRAACMRS